MRLKDRKRQAVISKILAIFFSFVAVGIVIVFVVRLPIFMVRGIEIVGNNVVEKAELEYSIRSVSDRYYFGIMPVATVLFYPKEKILSAVASSSPRIKSASLVLDDGVARLTVVERQIYALWCVSSDSGTCYLLDDDGLLFATAPLIEGESTLRYFGGMGSSTPVVLGMQYLGTKEAFLDLRFLLNQLQSEGIEAAEVHIDAIGSVSVVAKNKTIFFIGRRDEYTHALERLVATFADPTVPVSSLYRDGRLETLDVRFTGKVLFKEKK